MTKDRQAILPHQRGFTLVEIMVTLVIIAIAAALVSPAIMQMAPNMALKSAAQDLYSNMQRAKVTAIKENRAVGIQVGTAGFTVGEPFTDANGDGLYTAAEAYTDTDGDGSYTPDRVVVFANDYEHGIGLGAGAVPGVKDWADQPCIPAAAITFTSRGMANADSAFLQITPRLGADLKDYHNLSYSVSVATSGSVKVRKYDGTAPFNIAHWIQ